jgi:amino acid adenylation domain-containing protein
MLDSSGSRAIIVDHNAEPLLAEVVEGLKGLLLIFPEHENKAELQARYPTHDVFVGADLSPPDDWQMPAPQPDDIAYLLFTSGSTGTPKGVMVSHANIDHFLTVMMARYQLDESDRFSHMFDLVFDLSLFDLFMAWKAGGCVCCPNADELLLPAGYIDRARLTVWFSVPSVAVLSLRLRQLEADRFQSLNWSLFCGEALPADAASAWADAASSSTVENLYGPTELTLACALYRWKGEASLAECRNDIVPIGEAYPGMRVLIAREAFEEVLPGESGELLMTGPQVALGYWNDPEKTAAAFQAHPESGKVYYRTGDLVRWSDDGERLEYVGRVDNQVKIHGMRVELGEIEATIKSLTNAPRVVAVGYPADANGISGVTCFVEGPEIETAPILHRAKNRLPAYMVPKKLICVADFPLNANGKVDRKALLATLKPSS